jgi:acetyltransferase-like isoleucine patch superfamily enzyme
MMIDDIFDKNADTLRQQILSYVMSSVLTDAERAKFLGLPDTCRIREGAKIISKENLECGEHVWIGEGAVLDASGGLSIGDHTSIGLGVYIWSHTSFLNNLTFNNGVRNSDLLIRKKTTIGKGCFIGGPSVVYHGVTLGDRVVVLPMSVITKDVPSNCIVAGSPAKVIREIDDDFIKEQVEMVMKNKAK